MIKDLRNTYHQHIIKFGGYALRNTLINHQFQTEIKKNAKGTSCPYCSIPAKKVGYGNDLKTNFPAVTNFWDYEKNDNGPEEFLAGSGKKVWFLCLKNTLTINPL